MGDYVLAHDLGTTGNKASLYDAGGRLLGSAFQGYPTRFEQRGWAEQDPDDWWVAVCRSSKELLERTGTPKEAVACLVFSGQMMGCVPLDKDARPLRSAIIWADQRAVAQQRWLAERFPPEAVYRITGHRLSASYSLCKILWLRQQQPEIYREAHAFVHAKDALVARLTGRFATDPSDASGMNLFDLERGDWAVPILEAAQLEPDKLPEILPSTAVVGEVLPAVADETGLAAGTPVVLGGGDGCCAAVGAGVIREGNAYNYIGSSSWIALATSQPILDPQRRTFTWAHLIPGMFSPCGTMQAAGASYQWARDQLASPERQAAFSLDMDVYRLMDLRAETSPAGANGLLYLPYLLGERSPRWNPNARGTFLGLTIRHTRADLLRAVLEGVAMNLRLILDAFTAQGAGVDAVRLIGGGARSRLWNRIMADVYGLPVERLALLEEATSMGAAVTGGVGVGLYPDFSIIERMNPVVEVIEPDAANRRIYQQLLPAFDAAYHALEPVFEQLGAF